MSTGAVVLVVLAAAAAALIALEVVKLRTARPDDHITFVVRSAWKNEPGAVLMFVSAVCYLSGHLFWCECP